MHQLNESIVPSSKLRIEELVDGASWYTDRFVIALINSCKIE